MTKKRVLIANRGEIALRIIRSVKELDMEAIAVYSDVDADSLHVKRADEAYYLGGSLPSESYRNIKTLMKAITDTKADMVLRDIAVHERMPTINELNYFMAYKGVIQSH